MQKSGFYTAPDGARIWYGTTGRGPAMVLCDGFSCDGYIWPYIIDHFCDDYTIVRWHYRGHGRSDAPEDLSHLDMNWICSDLEGVLDTIGVEEAILVGHSMGVQVILQAYEDFPDRVSALIPICGTYKRPLETFNDSDILARVLPWAEKLTARAPDIFQRVWSRVVSSQIAYIGAHLTELNAKLIHGEDFRPYLEHTSQMDVRVYVGMLRFLSEHDAEHILPNIHVPTLIVASEFDSFTPLHRSESMHEMIPDSEMVILPGGSHAGPLELPDTVIGAMERFLNERASRQVDHVC